MNPNGRAISLRRVMVICASGDQLQLPSAFQRTAEGSLTRLRPGIFVNRPVRTRMLGGVGAGGEKPPATRFAIIVSGRSSRLAESPVIHPLSYECHRIRSAVFLAKTATYCCSAFAHRRVIHDRVDSVTDRLNGQPLLWYWRRPNSEALDLPPP